VACICEDGWEPIGAAVTYLRVATIASGAAVTAKWRKDDGIGGQRTIICHRNGIREDTWLDQGTKVGSIGGRGQRVGVVRAAALCDQLE